MLRVGYLGVRPRHARGATRRLLRCPAVQAVQHVPHCGLYPCYEYWRAWEPGAAAHRRISAPQGAQLPAIDL